MVEAINKLMISARGSSMPPSPIRRLVPFQEQAKAKGLKVFPLNIGEPDVPTPPLYFDTLRQKMPKVLDYSHSAGIASFRAKLAGYYNKYASGVEPSHVMVTTGGSEALLFAFWACLKPGDEVIVIEPCYANYIGFAVEAGVKLVPVTTFVKQDFALPPIPDIEAVITPNTKAILLCNPSNPTGKLYSREELLTLKALIQRNNLFLISDEVYSEFVYDGYRFHSALGLEGLEEHVVVCDSISKRYSACGARIGTLVSKNTEVLAAVLKFAQARLSPPTLGQIAAEALLDLPDSYFEEIVNIYKSRRNVVCTALRSIPGVVCPDVWGAFYLVPRLPIDDSDRFCQWLLESFEYKGSTVMMAPATGFYVTPGLGKQEVRIAYVIDEVELIEAMECLTVALNQYPG